VLSQPSGCKALEEAAQGMRRTRSTQKTEPNVGPRQFYAGINAAREIDRSTHSMRIIVIRQPTVPEVDGLDLRSFKVGRQYEVGTRIGSYLVAERWADFIDPSGRRLTRGPERRDPTNRRQSHRSHKATAERRRTERRRAERRTR